MQFQEFDISRIPSGVKRSDWLEITPRADGGTWQLPLLCVTGAPDGPILLVTAAVHGNEYEGVEAIPRIFEQVEPDALHGTLVMLPVCNMPAYEAGTRNSPIDGLNLARVFPGDPDGTITRRIAYWLTHKLIKHADFFIDLHSAGVESNIPTMIGYRHSEDELGQRARAAAHAFGAPVMWGHPPPGTSGRSISAATEYGVPWLYTESRGGGRAGSDDVACYINGVLNVMKHLRMIPGEPHLQSTTHHLVGDGNLDIVISAPVAGSFRPHVELLDEVSVGQRMGVIENLFGQIIGEVTADRDGIVILLRRLPQVNAGEGVAQITGKYSGD